MNILQLIKRHREIKKSQVIFNILGEILRNNPNYDLNLYKFLQACTNQLTGDLASKFKKIMNKRVCIPENRPQCVVLVKDKMYIAGAYDIEDALNSSDEEIVKSARETLIKICQEMLDCSRMF